MLLLSFPLLLCFHNPFIEYQNVRRSHTSMLHGVVLHSRDHVEDSALSEAELDDVQVVFGVA